MALPVRTRPKRPWLPWVKVSLAVTLLGGGAWGLLELSQRYLGLQKLTIEQVAITGCRGERLEEARRIAEQLCLGKPLFWFDADGLRQRLEERRWVKGLLIRKDPPDRISLVIEEREPLLWLVRPSGIFLVSDDGIVLDRVNQANLRPIPVVAEPASQTDAALLRLLRVATALRDRQRDFYERLSELRWTSQGAVAFLEGMRAPIFLAKQDPTRNIPNFQALFLSHYSGSPALQDVRYFDLRWEAEGGYVAVGDQAPDEPPASKGDGRK